MTLATRIAVMNGGIVQQLGTPKEIYSKPANLFVATFMGSPSMNLVDVEADSNGLIKLEPAVAKYKSKPAYPLAATPWVCERSI